MRAAHPTYNDSQVTAEAKAEFEAATMAFFVETINLCRQMRPKAYWGYYGIPENPNEPYVMYNG